MHFNEITICTQDCSRLTHFHPVKSIGRSLKALPCTLSFYKTATDLPLTIMLLTLPNSVTWQQKRLCLQSSPDLSCMNVQDERVEKCTCESLNKYRLEENLFPPSLRHHDPQSLPFACASLHYTAIWKPMCLPAWCV